MTAGIRRPRRSRAPHDAARLRLSDVGQLGTLGIRTKKLRAALSALGISIGIATIIIVTGVPASSQAALQAQLTALGTNVLQAQPLAVDHPATLPDDAVARVSRIAPVTTVAAVADLGVDVERSNRQPAGSGITALATSPELPATLNGTVASGRFLDGVSQHFPQVVLGHIAAGWLGITSIRASRPSPQLFVGGHWFTIVGILAPLPLAPDIDRSVMVGWGIAQQQLGFDGHPDTVYLKSAEPAIADVTSVLPPTLDPQIPGLIGVTRVSDVLAAKQAAARNFSSLYLGLAAVALLVGAIGVANTMVISVLERRTEIGLRRALGATRGHVRIQFLTEAALLALLGGVLGTVIGALATLAYAAYQSWPSVIPLPALVGGTAGAALLGIIAGLYPAIRAARLTPTRALAGT